MSPVRSRLPAPTFKPTSRRAFLDVGHGWRYTPGQKVSDWSRYANSAGSAPRARSVVIVLGGPLGSQPRGESRAVLFSQPPAAGSLCIGKVGRRDLARGPGEAPLSLPPKLDTEYDIRAIQEFPGHRDVKTTMISTQTVLNRGARGGPPRRSSAVPRRPLPSRIASEVRK